MKALRFLGVVAAVTMFAAPFARADSVVSDQSAAFVVYPLVISAHGGETVIQLSNTSNQQVRAKCYYVNAAGTCSVSREACIPDATESCPLSADVCVPGWVETDFQIWLTPQQPLAWLASRGMSRGDFPLDGTTFQGQNGASNAGSGIPPFGGEAGGAIGELKCYATNADGTPSPSNVLQGEAAFETIDSTTDTYGSPVLGGLLGGVTSASDLVSAVSLGKYNAIGFRAIPGANNEDNQLQLGGDGAEYDGCPSVLIFDHFFDGATNPVSGREVESFLVLTPCTEDFQTQVPTSVTAQYLVFNEFEQRFSTSKTVNCWAFKILSSIDTNDPLRSIFGVYVSGTLTGQTRIRGVNGGLIGVALQAESAHSNSAPIAGVNLDYQGQRDSGDVVTVVP